MAERRNKLINAGLSASALSGDATITGDWTFTGTTVVPEGTVTQHETALTILESQITDANLLARVADNETITGAWTFSADLTLNSDLDMRDGSTLKILNAGNTDFISISHDGTDAQINCSSTLDVDMTGHTGTIRVPAGSGIGLDSVSAKGFTMERQSLADDATGTWTVGSHACIIVKSNFNRTAEIAGLFTSQQAPIFFHTLGAAASHGNSTNPDVDGDANYWKSSSGVLSIKNRLGSTRAFTVYTFNAV